MAEGDIQYAMHEGVCCLKFVGEIRYTTGPASLISRSLDAFLDRLFAAGEFQDIVIDLSETRSIDSTNLGLLARIATHMLKERHRKVTIISTSDNITRTLGSMGFENVSVLVTQPRRPGAELAPLPSVSPEEKDRLRLMLDAHRRLMDISKANHEKFQDAVRLLEAELKKRPNWR